MANFSIGVPIETPDPTIEVTVSTAAPLPVGRHRFQLVVVDDSGNSSVPDTVDVIIRDTQNPTAILTVPSQVELGQTFGMDGRLSSDVAPGKVVRYIWTQLD